MTEQTTKTAGSGALHSFMDELPTDRLKEELGSFLGALAQRAIAAGTEKVGAATDKLTDYAELFSKVWHSLGEEFAKGHSV